MAITIPASAVKTFEKVMGALGGEDYSYYLFDVKNAFHSPSFSSLDASISKGNPDGHWAGIFLSHLREAVVNFRGVDGQIA